MINYGVSSVALWLLSLLSYLSFSKGYDSKDIRVNCGRIFIASLYVWLIQAVEASSIVSMQWIWSLVIGISWIVAIPVLQYISYNAPHIDGANFIDNSREIVFGIYSMSVLHVLGIILPEFFVPKFIGVAVLYVVFMIFMLIPLLYIMHYIMYNTTPSEPTVKAIQETYLAESVEYIKTYSRNGKILLAMSILLVISAMFIADNYESYRFSMEYDYCFYGEIVILLVGCVLLKDCFHKLRIYGVYINIASRRKNDKEYKKYAGTRQIKVNKKMAMPFVLPGTVILIIGESASRDYMHIYHEDIPYENTPWMEKMKKDEKAEIFTNTYACYNQTSEVLKRVLTEMSQYNNVAFKDAASIIEMARAVGYKTYWFSNQGSISCDDSAEALIANMSDVVYGNGDTRKAKYDHSMLDLLDKVDEKENNFIIFHLKGSHGQYKLRYPKDFARWPSDNEETAYHNTLLYTDEFLCKLYNKAAQKFSLQVMLYFSDHGDNLKYGHHPDIRTADTVRIPMFILLSEQYKCQFSQKYEQLQMHSHSYFSNDMMYNTIMGLLNIKSERYDSSEDLASVNYAYGEENTLTFLGDVKAADYDK